MKVAKVLNKGLVVIPKDIRDKLQIKEGDKVIWEFSKGKVILRPIKKGALTEKYKGIISGKLSPEELEELYGER
jgi:looped-hinge helix DNA binding domain, AbrB family